MTGDPFLAAFAIDGTEAIGTTHHRPPERRRRKKGSLDKLCVAIPLDWLARLEPGRLFSRQFVVATILWWHVALYKGSLTFKLRPSVIDRLPVKYRTFRRNLFARGLEDLERLGLITVRRNGCHAPEVSIIKPPAEGPNQERLIDAPSFDEEEE